MGLSLEATSICDARLHVLCQPCSKSENFTLAVLLTAKWQSRSTRVHHWDVWQASVHADHTHTLLGPPVVPQCA